MEDKKVGRKKHKRLDAICENEYSRTHRGVEDSGPSESKDGGDEMELRRSSRVRKIPVMLDTSPSPSKKRRKVMKGSGLSNGDCGDGEGELGSAVGDDGWRSRLRSRVRSKRKSWGFEVGKPEDSSPRGKRKLFDDCEVVKEESMTVAGDVERQKPGMVGEETTIVKSKRPGRIKASNILEDQCPKIDLIGSTDDDKEESIDREVLDVSVQVGRLFVSEIESDVDKNGDDANAPPPSFEVAKGGIEVDTELEKCPESSDVPNCEIEANVQLEECHSLDQLGDTGKYIQDEVRASDVAEDQSNAVEINAPNGDCNKDSDKPLETMTIKKLKRKRYHSDGQHGKIQIKEGRRCGLCGTGSEGKPPRKLVQDGAGSDNEAYSGSSSSEEPNYDMWDGFGDEPGWLGRLLGPMNDRHGIAGIWIHQQCAVWSPEVYFAGLGCLKNVRAALCRGRVLKCTRCGRPGATIGCRVDRCPRTYHLACARANSCIFDHRKFLIACTEHKYLFQPHGSQNVNWLKKLKMKKVKMELKKKSNEACRKDVEAEEKWLENCGEDEEFLKRESKRLHRDLLRIAPTYIGGSSGNQAAQPEGWESVAGLQSVIQCLKEVVILPLLYPEYFDNLGLAPPRGVLLHGYPGTGKTLVVRALIGACARGDKKIAYFARKGVDCLGKYVGDAERQLRLLFQVAEKSQPSIIFFDEIDGLAPCRTPQQDQTHSSVVSTLLALMDGLKSRGSVIVIGATNRPDAIDPALRRPGRFDREIYFPLPSVDDRESILSLHTRKWPKPISGSLLKMMARKTVGFAGADIQALCTQAAIISLRRSFPLQKILSAAADKAINYQRPPLPSVVVQERDWLEAFACAAPPCSRREAGCTTNELLSSPLPTYLESCLLQPLSRMIVSLHLDERVWLPPPISKAASWIENVIVSELGKRKVNQDNWWSHVTDMLEEAHISSTIEDGLRNVGIIEGGTCSSSYDILRNDNGDGRPDIELSRMQCSRPGLLQNESYDSKKKSGFRLLISGNRKSGQSHLASCLLHYFLGNVEVQKIDLATISHQGHGDVVQGLQQVLMRCASLRYCMIFMPRIDLWAVEIFNQEQLFPPTEFESSEGTSCNGYLRVDKGDSSPNSEVLDAVTKASYLWNLFVEQVESMSINSSLTIVATSEVQLSKLPQRIQQFFNVERINDGLLTSMGNSVPQFSVELDGIFDFDRIVESCSVRLSKDLAQHFAQFMHYGNHIHVTSSPKDNVSNVDQPSVGRLNTGLDTATESKQLPATTVSPASQGNFSVKGKSSLMVAIYTFGCQILFYPHFAELCWVTSKIKEGPCASIHGPWKGWPFNSCTVHSVESSERNTAAFVNNTTKNNAKSSIVRGLIAVGLSAYKGEYMSLRQVVSDVRKVLDLLVRLIDAKVQAGKDRYDYIRVMSQVAYLEDVVLSWAHTLQRFEADAQPIEADRSIIHKTSLNNGSSNKMCPAEGDVPLPDGTSLLLHKSSVPVGSHHELEANGVEGMSRSKASHKPVLVADKENPPDIDALLTKEEKLLAQDNHMPISKSVMGGVAGLRLNDATEASKNDEEAATESEPLRYSSGSTEFHSVRVEEEELFSGDRCDTRSKTCHLEKDASLGENNVPPENIVQNLNTRSLDGCHASGSTPVPESDITCFYRCCPECFVNLHSSLKEILNQWRGTEKNSAIEDVHDFVSRISSKLHSAIRRLPLPENSCCSSEEKTIEDGQITKHCHETRTSDCNGTKQPSLECHNPTSDNGSTGTKVATSGLDFIFRNGVLTSLDTSCDASFHCKWETLCICSLVEWIRESKESLICG